MMVYISAPARADDPEGLGRDLLMMFNSTGIARDYAMPQIGRGMNWTLFLDTAGDTPHDIFPLLNGPLPPSNRVVPMVSHSMKVYVSEPSAV